MKKEILIGNNLIEVLFYFKDKEIIIDKKTIKFSEIKRKNLYLIGLKSKEKLKTILKNNNIDCKQFMCKPIEPQYKFIGYGFNDFDDRLEKINYTEKYPALIEYYNSLPDDLFIILK